MCVWEWFVTGPLKIPGLAGYILGLVEGLGKVDAGDEVGLGEVEGGMVAFVEGVVDGGVASADLIIVKRGPRFEDNTSGVGGLDGVD